MILPSSYSAVTKVIAAKHVAESVTSGMDPSLLPLTMVAFSPQFAKGQTLSSDHVVEQKDMGIRPTQSENIQEKVVLEKYVDAKYTMHGNIEDAWTNLQKGELTFDCFILAMVDVLDILTFGLIKPALIEIKINPHIKARQVIYQAEVTYEDPQTISDINQEGLSENQDESYNEKTTVERRITQVSKVQFEISPETFKQADLSFAEAVSEIEKADLADRVIVYTRLDELTTRDLEKFSERESFSSQSQRLRSVETSEDIVVTGRRDINSLLEDGGMLLADKETLTNQICVVDISEPEETLHIISNDTQTSYLIRETNTVNSETTTSQKYAQKTGVQVTEIDYLENSRSVLSLTIEHKDIYNTITTNNVESKTHWKVFGWDTSWWAGENIETSSTPTSTNRVVTSSYELETEDNIAGSIGKSADTLVDKGAYQTGHSDITVIEHGKAVVNSTFEDGALSNVPLVGGLLNLPNKALLGGEVTMSDAFWAAADAAEIALLAVAVVTALPTGGASIGLFVSGMGAKSAAKSGFKALSKKAMKKSLPALKQTVVQKGRVWIKGISSEKLIPKKPTGIKHITVKHDAGNVWKESGKVRLNNTKQVGSKVREPQNGAIEKYKNIPKSNGAWDGAPGDSTFKPDRDYIPPKSNPGNKPMGEILDRNNVSDGVNFNKGEMITDSFSKAKIKIDNFTSNRAKNFAQADEKLAKMYTAEKKDGREFWSKSDVAKHRKENNLTYHENMDGTMDLVDAGLHNNIPHRGGISEIKNAEKALGKALVRADDNFPDRVIQSKGEYSPWVKQGAHMPEKGNWTQGEGVPISSRKDVEGITEGIRTPRDTTIIRDV